MQSEDAPKPPDEVPNGSDTSPSSFDPHLSDTVEMDALPEWSPAPFRPELPKPHRAALHFGDAIWISIKSPAKLTENEDSVSAFPIGPDRSLLVVADGLGGHRGGKSASQAVVRGLKKELIKIRNKATQNEITISGGIKIPVSNGAPLTDADYRSLILDQIETTNRRLLKRRSGAATTLALIEIQGDRARSYHVGDSPILIISQRGQIKFETVSHSPVGYAVEAGIISEQDAIYHEDRHLVSNVVGSKEMSVELGPWVPLAPRDTILIASDGLFDNLMSSEIVGLIRAGSLKEGINGLANLALDRMCHPQTNLPSKPDDLTILAYRRKSRRSNASESSNTTPANTES